MQTSLIFGSYRFLKKIKIIKKAIIGVVNIASSNEPQNPKEVFFPKLATDQKINKAINRTKISDIPKSIAQVCERIVVMF